MNIVISGFYCIFLLIQNIFSEFTSSSTKEIECLFSSLYDHCPFRHTCTMVKVSSIFKLTLVCWLFGKNAFTWPRGDLTRLGLGNEWSPYMGSALAPFPTGARLIGVGYFGSGGSSIGGGSGGVTSLSESSCSFV